MLNRSCSMLAAVSYLAMATAVPAAAAPDQPVFVPQPPRLSPPPPPSPPSDWSPVKQEDRLRTIAVRITAGGRELLNDRLRVRTRQGGTLSQTRGEAEAQFCEANRYSGEQTSISFRINSTSERPGDAYRINFSWTRPEASPDDCGRFGTNQVGLDQLVTVTRGAPTIIRGDGGVVIELREI